MHVIHQVLTPLYGLNGVIYWSTTLLRGFSLMYLIYGCLWIYLWCQTAGWFLRGEPLFYVFNNMLFTAHECLNWTYWAPFHSHLGKSMWSHIHACKICHSKMKLDGCARTCEVHHQISMIESMSLKMEFTVGYYGQTSRLLEWCTVKRWTWVNWFGCGVRKGSDQHHNANILASIVIKIRYKMYTFETYCLFVLTL